MNPLPGFATFGTAGFTADTSSFSFKGAYVKGLANRHFAGIPNRNSIAALHESTHLRVRESSGDASTCGGESASAPFNRGLEWWRRRGRILRLGLPRRERERMRAADRDACHGWSRGGAVLFKRIPKKNSRRARRAAWWPRCAARRWRAVDRGADSAAVPSHAAGRVASSAPKQTRARGAAAAAKASTVYFSFSSRLVSSCRRRT